MKSNLQNFTLTNKRALLRIDGNVPISEDGKIENLFRLQQIRPTLDYILLQNAQVILLTHIGRPKKQESYLSTKIIADWFASIGYEIIFAPTIAQAKNVPFKAQQVVMLENLRFFDEEQTPDTKFAKELASLGDYYVNDAFGTMHRNDTSITLLAKKFKKNKKTIGFLVERELEKLEELIGKKPLLAIIGGGKVETKLPLLAHLTRFTHTIIPLPALSFSFEQTDENNIGQSLVHKNASRICSIITQLAKKNGTRILLPTDYLVAEEKIAGKLSIKTISDFTSTDIGIAIGPNTIDLIQKEIDAAQSIFFNGVMGFKDIPATQESSEKILSLIAKSSAFSLISGGDTVSCAEKLGLLEQYNFVSSGGGAALQYISGEKLPGLEALQE